jgi:hypothetical protein
MKINLQLKSGMVVQTCNASTQDAQVGGPRIWDKPEVYI